MKIHLAVVCLISLSSGLAWAQQHGDAATTAPTTSEAKAEFDRRFAEYKEALLGIEQLRADYQLADEATREKVNAELGARIGEAQQRLDAMVSAAEEAYRQSPNSDPQVTDLLLAVANYDAVGQQDKSSNGNVIGGDRYELALPIIRMLIDGGASEQQLPVWGLVCAFATNDYDLAEEYAQMAEDSGVLSGESPKDTAAKRVQELAAQYAESIEKYRALWAKETAIRAAEAEADDLPRVLLTTTQGDIVLELFENEAPETVAIFITLVKQGFYDGLAFHRVIPKFVVQGGDPRGDGAGGPGYAIRCECYEPDARKHFRGSLSMAHSGRDTGGSQFFLTFVPTGHLDGLHTVFGRVVEGLDVMSELQQRSPSGNPQRDLALPEPDRILKAEVLRDRGHDYDKFEKLPAP